jgi:hypothetical protein
VHLPEQRTRDRQLDRDDRLKILNRHIHAEVSIYDPTAWDRRHARRRERLISVAAPVAHAGDFRGPSDALDPRV